MIVCSKSTKKYRPNFPDIPYLVIDGAPTTQTLVDTNKYDFTIAIGGGKVIDTAKIISKKVFAYPTTASGAAMTSRAVYWNGKIKKSILREPAEKVFLMRNFIRSVPITAVKNSYYDAIGHCLDVKWSKYRSKQSEYFADEALEMLTKHPTKTEIVIAGNIAGQAIELCDTTILHGLSYPMTARYGMEHGEAIGFWLPIICDHFNFDLSPYKVSSRLIEIEIEYFKILTEAIIYYPKILNTERKIDFKYLIEQGKRRLNQ